MKNKNNIIIKESKGRGRGVFALCSFKKGTLIEKVPVLVFDGKDYDGIQSTKMVDYTYGWGDKGDKIAIAFGFGSFYNHSYNPNAEYYADEDSRTMSFYARRAIKEGEEIFINYNCDPENKTPVWFDVLEKKNEKIS